MMAFIFDHFQYLQKDCDESECDVDVALSFTVVLFSRNRFFNEKGFQKKICRAEIVITFKM